MMRSDSIPFEFVGYDKIDRLIFYITNYNSSTNRVACLLLYTTENNDDEWKMFRINYQIFIGFLMDALTSTVKDAPTF